MNAFGALWDLLQAFGNDWSHGIATGIIGGIFVWSGVAKLRIPTLVAITLVDFGVARRVHPHLGRAIALMEVSLGIWVSSRVLVQASLAVAMALFWGFAFLITRSLVQGRKFPCHCFGKSATAMSSRSLWRAFGLAFLGTISFLAVAPGSGTSGEVAFDAPSYAAALSILGVVALVSAFPKLLRLNADPYAVGVVVEQR